MKLISTQPCGAACNDPKGLEELAGHAEEEWPSMRNTSPPSGSASHYCKHLTYRGGYTGVEEPKHSL